MAVDPAIAALNHKYAVKGCAEIVVGNGGLSKIQIATDVSYAEMYLHGAHVTSWKPRGAEEILFVSSQSFWKDGRAIRGGVPICFPWFANRVDNPKAPAHGLVRTKAWNLEAVESRDGIVTVTMSTESDANSRRYWPADFRLSYRATFGTELGLELIVENIGQMPFRFEEALHTYLSIANIRNVSLRGLDGASYIDKTDANREKVQRGDVSISEETDRVYLHTRHAIELTDEHLRRRIVVTKENSLTTIVWNPWTDKAKALPDLGDSEWTRMVCVETSNVGACGVDLPAGGRHEMRAIIAQESYD